MAAVATSPAGPAPDQALTLDIAAAAQVGARNEAAKLAALQAQAGLDARFDAAAVDQGGPLYAQQATPSASNIGFRESGFPQYDPIYDARAAAMASINPNMDDGSMTLAPGEYVGGYDGEYAVQYGGGDYGGGEYGYDDVDMGEEDEYDEEDDLSSSPSIPDENIDFDLVYALHNFIATVEGQATVQKGNSLTLLDDSNSYWWLVRVLQTQEVGYIPAENIESPFERLARLNKHRNVDLSSATPADQVQVEENVHNSYLSKSREERVQILPSSGKLSALSRRFIGAAPEPLAYRRKSAVVFGHSSVVELSEHEEWSETEEEGYDDESGEEGEQGDLEEAESTPEERLAWEQEHAAYLQQQQQLAHYANYGHISDMSQDLDGDHQTNANQKGLDPYAIQHTGVDSYQARYASGQEQPSPEEQQYYGQQQAAQQQIIAHQQQQQQQQQQQGLDQQMQLQQQHQTEPRPDLEMRGLPAGQSTAGARFSPEQREPSPSQDQTMVLRDASSLVSDSGTGSPTSERQGKRRSSMFGLFSRHKKDRNPSRTSLTGSVHSHDEASDEGMARPPSISVSNETPQLAVSSAPSNVTPPARSPRGSLQPDPRHLSIYGAIPSSGSGGLSFAGSGRPRPGSLIMPGGDVSVPMLNVLRVFAAPDLESNATYKTVLLNETTTANEIVKQAVQRFGIRRHSVQSTSTTGESSAAELDFALMVRVVDGEERILAPDEVPLKVYEHITEHEANALMPSVRRSSVGSISSVASNLSAKSAITKLNHDFSDDHAVKFFLTNRARSVLVSSGTGMSADINTTQNKAATESDSTMRYGVRVLIFPDELPRSLVFDPSSSSIVRRSMLSVLIRHGSSGNASRGQTEVNTAYREKILAIPRVTTVAEVIELALDKFGIPQGVAEGGDEKDSRRRDDTGEEDDEVFIPYGLTLDVGHGEHHLRPSSAVYDAFNSPPTLRNVPRESSSGPERRSLDSSTMLHLMADMRSSDPVFILRQQQHLQSSASAHISRTARAWSPTEQALASKRDAQRRSQIDMVRSSSDPSMTPGLEAEADRHPPSLPPPIQDTTMQGTPNLRSESGPSAASEQARTHELIVAQRAQAGARALKASGGLGAVASVGAMPAALPGAATPHQVSSISEEPVRPRMTASGHDLDDNDNIDAVLKQVIQETEGTMSEGTPRHSRDPNGLASIASMTAQGMYPRDDGGSPPWNVVKLNSVQPLRPHRSRSSTPSASVEESALSAEGAPPVSSAREAPATTAGMDDWELLAEPREQDDDDVPMSAATSVLDVPGAYRSPSPSPAPSPSPTSNQELGPKLLTTGAGVAATSAGRAPETVQAPTVVYTDAADMSVASHTDETARSISNPVVRPTATTATGHQATPSGGSGSALSRGVVSPTFASPTQSSTTSPISSRMTPVAAGIGGAGRQAFSPQNTASVGTGARAPSASTPTGKSRSGHALGPISLDHLYAVMDAAAHPSSRPGSATPLSKHDSRSLSRSGVRASRVPEASSGYSSSWSDCIWPDAQSVRAEQALQLCGGDGKDAMLVHFFAPPLSAVVSASLGGSSGGSAPAVSARYLQMDKHLGQVDQKLDQLLADALRLP